MAKTRQLTPQFNSRYTRQVDIQHKAGSLAQVSALKKAFTTIEDLSIKPMDLQHPLHRPEDTRVIVYDNY
jgi:hypothetical protein